MKYQVLAITLPFVLLLVIIAFLSSPGSAELQSGTESNINSCSIPLTYQFGKIDHRFKIEKDELAAVMKEVENIWSSPLNTDMLHYDPNGDITIDFVYSGVQKLTKNERVFSKRIESQKVQRKTVKNNFQDLKKSFKEQLAYYNQIVSKYERAINNYNRAVKKGQNHQDLTDKQKAELKKFRSQIDQIKHKKNKQYRRVETLRKRANHKAEQLKRLVQKENRLIESYNKRFSGQKKFNQGHYIKRGNEQKINVYQYNNLDELTIVLTHEFGHALGLEHGENPRSVMYYLMNEKNQKNPSLSKEDIEAITRRCF